MTKNRSTFGWLYKGMRPHIPMMTLLVFLDAVLSAVSVYFAVAVKEVIDAVLEKSPRTAQVIALLIITVAVQIILRALNGYIETKLRAKLEITYKTGLLGSLLKKDSSFMKYHSGDLMSRFTSDAQVISDGMAKILPAAVSMTTRIVCVFIVMLSYDRTFALLLMAGGAVLIAVSRLLRKKMKAMHKKVQETDGKWRSYLHEILSHMTVVEVFQAQKEVDKRSKKLQLDNLIAKMKRSLLHISMGTGYSLLFQGAYVYTLIWGAFNIGPAFTYGTLSAMLNLITQIQMPLTNLSGLLTQAAGVIASAERIIEIEQLPELSASEYDNRELMEQKDFAVNIRELHFAYDRDEVFRGASVSIKKGDFTVISGASGIGKSTLFKLILGTLRQNSGTIELNIDGQSFPAATGLSGAVSLVPQGNLIFSGTVRENIAFAKPTADESEILRAARISLCDRFISELPDGIDTVIGERGFGLSEGQIQRLAIARAILYDAPLMLLDEATSALDEETEEAVLENLKSLGKTVVLISHKKAALRLCTRNITVENGVFIEKQAGDGKSA